VEVVNQDRGSDEICGWYDPPNRERSRKGRRPEPDLTEAEWLGCADTPWWMVEPFERARERLDKGDGAARPRPGRSPSCREWRPRKARLLACAAAGRVSDLLVGSLGTLFQDVIDVAERHAEGAATEGELRAARDRVREFEYWSDADACGHCEVVCYADVARLVSRGHHLPPWPALEHAVMYAMEAAMGTAYAILPGGDRGFLVRDVIATVVAAAGAEAAMDDPEDDHDGPNGGTVRMSREMCHLVRDIFGNPFRPVTLDPSWRTSTVLALARRLYDSRDFSAMPILSDALMDAGCDHPDVLGHCRGGGPHVRGCWVVDLVLGKG
jgi:hypothetical protein